MPANKAASRSTVSGKKQKVKIAKSLPAAKKSPVPKTRGAAASAVAAKVAKPPVKVGKAAKKPKPGKEKKAVKKIKVVRDSFTMPQADYARIDELKARGIKLGLHVKKSELLRAGLQALDKLSAAQLKAALATLEPIKTGRPKKN